MEMHREGSAPAASFKKRLLKCSNPLLHCLPAVPTSAMLRSTRPREVREKEGSTLDRRDSRAPPLRDRES